MKGVLYVLGALLTVPAFATTMCAQDDVVAIVLDPDVPGTGFTNNANLYEWSTVFPYGTVWGIATCLDVKGTGSVAAGADFRAGDGELVVGGERKGEHCWCQMTHPAVSRWVFQGTFDSVGACGSNCAIYCGIFVRNSALFRSGVFGSLGSLGNGTDIWSRIKVLLTCRTKCV